MPDNQPRAPRDGELARSNRRSAIWSRALAALVVLVVVVSGFSRLSSGGVPNRLLGNNQSGSRQTDVGDRVGRREALAAQTLDRQASALAQGSQPNYLAAWDTSTMQAQQRAETTYQNLRDLGISSLDSRYVAADVGVSLAERQRLGGDAWKADVEVSYALDGYDSSPARMTVSYTFVRRGDRVLIVDVQAATGERAPVWILGPLSVRTSGRTLVAAASAAEARRVSQHLRQAVTDVQAVLPSWRGTLVAYVPETAAQLKSVLATAPGSYDDIAAVTTTVDGSDQQGAPVVVVVNASVFDRLGPIGSHVVISHESTHAATGAAVVGMPLWVAEGFADYVGVGAVDVPISVSARVVTRDVRRAGAPRALPSNDDFSAGQGDLELAYERAWLANRLIAAEHGERSLVRFYRSVVARPADLAGAFDHLGTTEEAFTADWRRSLRTLAARG